MVYVLGAPGSGKTSLRRHLQRSLPGWVVLDWDAPMAAAGALAGTDIASDRRTWSAYGELVRAFIDQVLPGDLVLLGVCTPDELRDWPAGVWMLLDCDDETRRRRLGPRGDEASTLAAMADAAAYREWALPAVDTTDLDPAEVAAKITLLLRAQLPT